MRQQLLTVSGVLVGLFGMALLLDFATGVRAAPSPCDNKYASASVGSCGVPPNFYLCSGATTQAQCTDPNLDPWVEVKQDFPVECLASTGCATNPDQPGCGKNCNMPDRDCSRRVMCKWDANATPKCNTDPNSPPSVWATKPKRETVNCP